MTIIQYLHPEGPCSPGGSSAAVAIQGRGSKIWSSWVCNLDDPDPSPGHQTLTAWDQKDL